MGSPILLKLCSHDEAMASRVFQLIKRYEDLLTVNRAESQVRKRIARLPPRPCWFDFG